jgi:uncharacterized protein (DUF1778 family)
MFSSTLELKNLKEHLLMLQQRFHKSRTDFILEMACQAAENVILDRRVFNFNDEQYAEFIDMLDAPVSDEALLINFWQGNLSGTCNSTRTIIQLPSTG